MPSSHLDFQQAKANHLLFKSRLRAILYDETPEAEATVTSQYACAVGKWIYGHALITYEGIPEVHTLEEVHAAIHTIARELVARYQQGQVGEARQGLVRVEQLADELIHLLDVVESKVTTTDAVPPLHAETIQQSADNLLNLLHKNQQLDAKIRNQSIELAQKELIFNTIMAVSPVALWMSDAQGDITYLNQAWIDWTGKPFETHLGGGWLDSIVEEDRSRASQQFTTDLAAQRPYAIDFRIRRQNGAALWCAVTGQPWYTSEGLFGGYVGSGTDVTEYRNAEQLLRQKTENERQILHDFFMQAPAAHCILRGPNHSYELVNPGYKELVGQRNLLGKSVREAHPEVEGQGFFELLDQVFSTGEAFIGREVPFSLDKGQGVHQDAYVNFIYQPIDNQQGETDGILVFAYEVTEQVVARRTLQESKDQLAFAIEAAELGSWDYNLLTGTAQWSATCKQLFGLSPDAPVTSSQLLERVHPADKDWVRQANAKALSPHSDEPHDIIFRTLREDSGERWVRAKGKSVFNEQGQIARFSGIIFDITELRQSQEALQQNTKLLEERVQQRTQQLSERNGDLQRSNQNLEQFAYVASHDLQEPLRKVQQFGDLLKNQYADGLGEGVAYLERMQLAAGRMSVLIKDLLSFSRIATGQDNHAAVSLDQILQTAVTDLDLRIQETGAEVAAAPLPTVQGDSSQLGQMFQNLLNNALKFRRVDTPPLIRVTTQTVLVHDLPPTVKPTRAAVSYHRIDVMDNGIGFDQKYVDRIFQVFQRLHGKGEYAGTGIGLAICEKVVTNHGGAITARSELGQGATFSVYLPVDN
ncbi:PAS domain S-box protein [Spirosoma arcticum]